MVCLSCTGYVPACLPFVGAAALAAEAVTARTVTIASSSLVARMMASFVSVANLQTVVRRQYLPIP